MYMYVVWDLHVTSEAGVEASTTWKRRVRLSWSGGFGRPSWLSSTHTSYPCTGGSARLMGPSAGMTATRRGPGPVLLNRSAAYRYIHFWKSPNKNTHLVN